MYFDCVKMLFIYFCLFGSYEITGFRTAGQRRVLGDHRPMETGMGKGGPSPSQSWFVAWAVGQHQTEFLEI